MYAGLFHRGCFHAHECALDEVDQKHLPSYLTEIVGASTSPRPVTDLYHFGGIYIDVRKEHNSILLGQVTVQWRDVLSTVRKLGFRKGRAIY
jgi:hypothetical protein